MLKVEHIETMGWRAALRGMRNAMNSWKKSDTTFDSNGIPTINKNDMQLATNLIKAGSPDRKFLRMIHIQMDITAPLYWWKEYDTYKIATTANSCSTMHKIHSKKFTEEDFSTEHLSKGHKKYRPYIAEITPFEDDTYDNNWTAHEIFYVIIQMLNECRDKYNETKDKEYWWQMIQLLPSSYNQRRTVDLDYETAMNIWHCRHAHKLDEWHALCDIILGLPYMKEFIEAMD